MVQNDVLQEREKPESLGFLAFTEIRDATTVKDEFTLRLSVRVVFFSKYIDPTRIIECISPFLEFPMQNKNLNQFFSLMFTLLTTNLT